MARKSIVEPRDQDERFKTHAWVSRVLSAEAESAGIAKQEIIHRIVAEWAGRKLDAARLLLALADGEGTAGHGRD